MRIANVSGRVCLQERGIMFDLAGVSEGLFDPDPQGVYDRWDELVDWFGRQRGLDQRHVVPCAPDDLGPPVPRPRQVFAVGLNYAAHAKEAGVTDLGMPPIFTKFCSSFAGPSGTVELSGDKVDWEAELVVVVGRTARHVTADEAWNHVAGVTIGQDLSDRAVQFQPPYPQFSLGKSFPGYAPMGPCVVTIDELADPGNLRIRCTLNDVPVQDGQTIDMILGVPQLVARLSRTLVLYPGDLIFTGTPEGVGMGRSPAKYLSDGDRLVTEIHGLGKISQVFRGPHNA